MKADANMKEGQMAGHMRDNKGQFKKGYHGLKPVGSSSGKKKKLVSDLKDRRLTTKTAMDKVNVTTRVRDVGNDDRLLNPATITKDPAGKYQRGDKMPPMARLDLSKNQKARVAKRKTDLLDSRTKRVKQARIKNVNDDAKAAKAREITANNKKDAERRAEIQRVGDANARELAEAKARGYGELKPAAKKPATRKPKPKTAPKSKLPAGARKVGPEEGGDGGYYSVNGVPIKEDGTYRSGPPNLKDGLKTDNPKLDKLRKERREKSLEINDYARTPPEKLQERLKEMRELDAKIREEEQKSKLPPAPKAQVVSPKDKQIAELQARRDYLSVEMGSIAYDYREHGDNGVGADDGYIRLGNELEQVDRKLKKLRPAGAPQVGIYGPVR